jgi:hypothetical protein
VLGVITAAGLVLVGAGLCGGAIWRACGLLAAPSAATACGLATLLFLAAVGIRLPGRAATAGALIGLAIVAAAAYLWRTRTPTRPRLGIPMWAWVTAIVVLVAALIPFAAVGRVGILGVGTNDDMTEHLLAAWALQGPHADVLSKLVHSGYPIAPHALAAAITGATGISIEQGFMGLLVAVPAVLALAAAGLISVLCERLGEPFPSPPTIVIGLAGALAGVCYLQSAFLAQASFKEPLESVFVVAFAAALLSASDLTDGTMRRHVPVIGIPAAVLASGAVYVYSYPGLAWIGGTLIVWTAVLAVVRRGRLRRRWRIVAVAAGAFLLLTAPEIPRLVAFAGSGYNRETAHVFGNLTRALPPREVLGIWPRLDFRFDVAVGSPAGIAGLVTFAALVACLIRGLRRREAMPAILFGVAAALYGVNALRSPYSAAKTMTILAPIVVIILGREAVRLLAERPPWTSIRTGGIALLALLLGWGAYSDLEVLRDAPVGPHAHADELAALRVRIGQAPTLFLGADDFIHWELRGAAVATPPAPLYTTTVVPLRVAKAHQDPRLTALRGTTTTLNRFAGVGLAFDFDSIPAATLDRFAYAILPRFGYRSTPPRSWRLVTRGASYELWRRAGATPVRGTLTEVDNPGAILDCRTARGRRLSERRGTAMVRATPVVGEPTAWHQRIGYAGGTAWQRLALRRGRWVIALQYAAIVPITVTGPGLNASLPAAIEPRGPYWRVGTIDVRRARGPTRLTVRYAELPWFGRALGAVGLTRAPTPSGLRALGRITASPAPEGDHAVPLRRACGRYVDWYVTG